jgi:hypothetical protein
MALLLKHQTVQEFVSRVREAYRNGEKERLVRIARFILSRIQMGDITDAQCRNAFGLNTTQWANAKIKMQTLIDANDTVQTAVGE